MLGLLLKTMKWVGGVGAMLFGVLIVFQGKIVYVPYVPGRDYDWTPEMFRMGHENVWLRSRDGTKLHAWLIFKGDRPDKTLPTVLFFQENAGNISHRLPYMQLIQHHMPCNALMLSYRGYGQSEGTPSEAGIKADAQAALDYLLQRVDIDRTKLVLFGRSLGGAVAIHLASKNVDAVRALMLENTFTSIPDMAGAMFPALAPIVSFPPVHVLITNKWRNIKAVEELGNLPVLMLSSGQDEMVPAEQMHKLRGAVSSPNVTWVEFPHGRHMDTYNMPQYKHQYWSSLGDFFAKNCAA